MCPRWAMVDDMDTEQALKIISSLLEGGWLESEKTTADELWRLGFSMRNGPGEELSPGVVQRELEPPPGIDQASLSTLDGEPTGVVFFIASAADSNNAETKEVYESLTFSLSQILGSSERVWADEPSPVQWCGDDLDVGLQPFDRRDSSVMVWVEHRGRSQKAELRAH